MPFPKICVFCEKPFVTAKRVAIACSTKCGNDHKSRRSRLENEKAFATMKAQFTTDLKAAVVAKSNIDPESPLPSLWSASDQKPRAPDNANDHLGRRILVIPDTQVKPGINTDHIAWIGKYIAYKRPDYVVMLGDWWDMPSLCSYDKGKKSFEGRRYVDDVEAGNAAMKLLTSQYRSDTYHPEEHFLIGNHEDRITRATDLQAELTGLIGLHQLDLNGWIVHSFLQVVYLEGIAFSHYFTSGPMNRPVSSAAVMLRIAQGSAVQGHAQKVDIAVHEKTGKIAMMAGIAYRHEEEYLGPQGNNCRQQVVMLNECMGDGVFDPMLVSLRYLEKRYGGGA